MNIDSNDREIFIIQKNTKKGSIGCALSFLLMALAILIPVVLGLLGIIKTDQPRWNFLLYVPFVLVFSAIAKGVYYQLCLQTVTVNRRERTLVELYGSGTGKKKEVRFTFDDLSAVALMSKVVFSQQGGASTYFEVWIRFKVSGMEKTRETELASFLEDYLEARRYAEHLAKFIGIPLEDSAHGEETIIRSAEDLDLSIRERAKKFGTPVVKIERPVDAATRIRKHFDRVEIEFPPYKFKIGCLVPLAMMAVIIWFALDSFLSLFSSTWKLLPEVSPVRFYIGLTALIVPVLLTGFFLILAKGRRQKLILDSRRVEHIMYRVLPRKSIAIPRNEIEEILLGKGTLMDQGPFVIRGDRQQITIENTAMSLEERRYIKNLIEADLQKR